MLARMLSVCLRRIVRSRILVILLLGIAAIYLFPALRLSSANGMNEQIAVEELRSNLYEDPTDSPLAESAKSGDASAIYAWHKDIEANSAAKLAVEAYDTGDMSSFYSALADYNEITATSSSMSRVESELISAQYRALAENGASTSYDSSGTMPGTLYAISGQNYLLAPFAQLAPVLFSSTENDGLSYTGSIDYLLWTVPLITIPCIVASMQTKRRLISNIPASPRRLAVITVASCTIVTAVVSALICIPGIAAATIRNGFGNLSYPVSHLAYTTVVTDSVLVAIAQHVALYCLLCLVFSLLICLSVQLFDSIVPGAVLSVLLSATTLFPGYFTGGMALRKIAAYLPSTYLNIGLAAGSYYATPLAATCALRGVSFLMGVKVLGVTATCLLAALLLMAPLGHVRFWGSKPKRTRFKNQKPTSTQHQNEYFNGNAMREYMVSQIRVGTKSLELWAATGVMALAIAAPTLLPISFSSREFSVTRYQNEELQRASAALSKDALLANPEEQQAVQQLCDDLRSFVYASSVKEQCKHLAQYERHSLLADKDWSSALSAIREEPFDRTQSEAKAIFLEEVASLPKPILYTISTLMPTDVYLSYLYKSMPVVFWFLPATIAVALLISKRRRGSLLEQAPLSIKSELTSIALASLILAVLSLAAALALGSIPSLVKTGLADTPYPVVLIIGPAVLKTTTTRYLVCSTLLISFLYAPFCLALSIASKAPQAAHELRCLARNAKNR